MKNRLISLLLLALSVVVLPCCGTSRTLSYELDHPLLAEGLAVDVRNFRGGVDVRVDPDLDNIVVESRVHVSLSIPEEHRAEAIEAVEVHAQVIEQHGHAVLQVYSETNRPLAEDHAVELFIKMPRCDGVYIENAYGLVELVNVRGAMRVANHKGAIEIRTKHPVTEPVTLTAVDGSIWYQVPKGSAGYVDIESMDGDVRFADKLQGSNQVYDAAISKFEGRLNDGTNPILARTNKGDIHVLVLEDPVALTRALHAPRPKWENMIFAKGSRRYLRNLPEDHPEVRRDTRSGPALGTSAPIPDYPER